MKRVYALIGVALGCAACSSNVGSGATENVAARTSEALQTTPLILAQTGQRQDLLLGVGAATTIDTPFSIPQFGALAAGDLTNTGTFSLVQSPSDVGSTLLSFDASGNVFSRQFPGAVFNAGDAVRIGDLNGDGFADVVLLSVATNTLSVYPSNNAPLSDFVPPRQVDVGGNPGDIAVCDLDGDGIDEIIYDGIDTDFSKTENTYPIYTKSPITSALFFGSRIPEIGLNDKLACADLNGDGLDDLIVARQVGTYDIYTMPGLPLINFFPNDAPVLNNIGDQIVAGDLDGDGFAEVVTFQNPSDDFSQPQIRIFSAPGKTPPPVPSADYARGDMITIPRPNPKKQAQSSFVVPFVPEAILYEMPGDKSKASYGIGAGVGTSTVWTNTLTMSTDTTVSGATAVFGGSATTTFTSSSSTSNGTSQNLASSTSISESWSDKTLNPKHDLYFLAMNVPGTKTDRGPLPPHYDVALAQSTLISLSAEQLQGLAQSPPDLSLFEPGQLQPAYVGSSSVTLTDLIKPDDAQGLLALDPQIQGQDITQDPDRFVRAQIPSPAQDGTLIPATIPMLAPPIGSGIMPSITTTVVTTEGSSMGTGQSTSSSFKESVGVKVKEDSVMGGVTTGDGFSLTFSKVTTTTISNSFTASVTIATDDPCSSGSVDLYLDQAFGTYVSVPHLTNLCAPTIGTQSFENLNQWAMSGGSAMLSNVAADGQFSFAVTGTTWTTLTSNPLNSDILRALATSQDLTKISYALEIPTNQPNPYWTGNTQMYVSSPSANVYNAYLGQVQLTGLPQGSFQRMEFTVPSYALPALTGHNTDVTFTIVLNVNPAPVGWLVDDLRLGE